MVHSGALCLVVLSSLVAAFNAQLGATFILRFRLYWWFRFRFGANEMHPTKCKM